MIVRRGKAAAVLLALAALALIGFVPTREWAHATAAGAEPFSVTGADLAPALPALALALAALTLALLFARRAMAVVVGVVLAVIGSAVIALSLRAPDPAASAIQSELQRRTGVTDAVPADVDIIWSMPILTAIGGGIALLGAIWTLSTAHRWRRPKPSADRYEARSGALAWDVLDDGDDPTADAEPRDGSAERRPDSD